MAAAGRKAKSEAQQRIESREGSSQIDAFRAVAARLEPSAEGAGPACPCAEKQREHALAAARDFPTVEFLVLRL